jgi:hypothetical protein
MDTGDPISSLTVYSSALARGSPVRTDEDITAAVVMADTAADVALTAAVAGDTAVAIILQEDVADTPADMVGMQAVDFVDTVGVPDSVGVAVSTALAAARTAAVVVTAIIVTAVVVTAVMVTAIIVTAVADAKISNILKVGRERLALASLSLLVGNTYRCWRIENSKLVQVLKTQGSSWERSKRQRSNPASSERASWMFLYLFLWGDFLVCFAVMWRLGQQKVEFK